MDELALPPSKIEFIICATLTFERLLFGAIIATCFKNFGYNYPSWRWVVVVWLVFYYSKVNFLSLTMYRCTSYIKTTHHSHVLVFGSFVKEYVVDTNGYTSHRVISSLPHKSTLTWRQMSNLSVIRSPWSRVRESHLWWSQTHARLRWRGYVVAEQENQIFHGSETIERETVVFSIGTYRIGRSSETQLQP